MKRTIYSVSILSIALLVILSGCEYLPLGPAEPRDNPFDPDRTEEPAETGDEVDSFKVYYVECNYSVSRCGPDGSDPAIILDEYEVNEIWSIAVDEEGKELYAADGGVGLISFTMLGFLSETVIEPVGYSFYDVHSVAIDRANALLYFADEDNGRIYRSDLEGETIADITPAGISRPLGLNVDGSSAKLYWVDRGTQKIQRSDLNGTNVEDILTSLNEPVGLALDSGGGKLYWTDIAGDHISRCNLDGTGVEIILTGLSDPWGIEVDSSRERIFYSQNGTGTVCTAGLDGSEPKAIVSGLTDVLGIALYRGQ